MCVCVTCLGKSSSKGKKGQEWRSPLQQAHVRIHPQPTIRTETITNENLGIFLAFVFVMERQVNKSKVNSPSFSFAFAFVTNIGRLIFIHLQCWKVLPFVTIQRQQCIKFRGPQSTGFYTPLGSGVESSKWAAPPTIGGVYPWGRLDYICNSKTSKSGKCKCNLRSASVIPKGSYDTLVINSQNNERCKCKCNPNRN